jgi:acetone carboxylase gamma subunit
VSEYLEVGDGRIRCARCAEDFCAEDQNYKLWVLQDRAPITEIPGVGDPTPYELEETLELRLYYCPGCAVQIDTEVALPGDQPLWDIELEPAEGTGA